MITALIVLHVVVCILLVLFVLLQFGKGAEVGAVMGGGASQAVFTSSQGGNIFSKITTVLAIIFMLNSIILSTLISKEHRKSIFDKANIAPIARPLNSDAEKAQAEAAKPVATEEPLGPGIPTKTETKAAAPTETKKP